MKKILSVSIAAYNVSKTLAECVEPFLRCTALEQLDIMIVDDGSKDKTASIAQKYASRFPNSIRLISKENGGWGSTVNTGIQNAKGLYFRQLDGDDYYNPENLAVYVDFLSKSGADMVVAPYVEYDEQTGDILAEKDCNPGCSIGKIYALKDLYNFAPFMHSVAVKTALLKDSVDVTEKCFYTDTEFVLKACNQVNSVMFFDKAIYYYRRASVGQSMSLDGMEKHYADQTKVIEVMLKYMKNEVKREEVQRIYDNLLKGTCWWQYLVLLYIHPTKEHKKALVSYDRMLKKNALQYYKEIHFRNLTILRHTFFIGYSYFAKRQKEEDNRFSEDGRLLF
jgi:glycosyltransferase involved in cell wall biosynthesis